jgi:hypothetical protein
MDVPAVRTVCGGTEFAFSGGGRPQRSTLVFCTLPTTRGQNVWHQPRTCVEIGLATSEGHTVLIRAL